MSLDTRQSVVYILRGLAALLGLAAVWGALRNPDGLVSLRVVVIGVMILACLKTAGVIQAQLRRERRDAARERRRAAR